MPFFKADNLWRAVSFAKLASAVYDANETEIAKELGKKLGKDEAASDSAKLIGVEGANFHRKDDANGAKITTITSLEVDLRQSDNFVLNLSSPGKLTLKNGTIG